MIPAIVDYIRQDFYHNARRASFELIGIVFGVAAAILLALTTPEPEMLTCYILWLIGSSILFICSVSRGSTGLALSYAIYFIIDSIGLLRTVLV